MGCGSHLSSDCFCLSYTCSSRASKALEQNLNIELAFYFTGILLFMVPSLFFSISVYLKFLPPGPMSRSRLSIRVQVTLHHFPDCSSPPDKNTSKIPSKYFKYFEGIFKNILNKTYFTRKKKNSSCVDHFLVLTPFQNHTVSFTLHSSQVIVISNFSDFTGVICGTFNLLILFQIRDRIPIKNDFSFPFFSYHSFPASASAFVLALSIKYI